MKTRNKIMAVALVSMVLVGASAIPAFAAEGTINTSVTQVQPGFNSRTWVDHNTTSNATTVKFSSCKDNAGGGAPGSKSLGDIGLDLYQVDSGGDILVGYEELYPCGTFSFGRQAAGSYYFEIDNINGDTGADRANFVNATVVITY